jgi:uncharacterized protein YhaN
MRILSLELERYGPFTNRTLLFNPTARLHVVHGRNATGKSCALAGITDLFFSIEPQTRYSFLHEGKTMRLGATLQGRNLSTLAFKRRKGKGNKNVLFTPAGESLDDNVLYPFLGDLTRGVFSHAFGLNSEQLRAGAEEMLDNEGEVGASLYAAASGLSGISRLRRQLDEEAAAIFKTGKGSKTRRFDQAAEAYSLARAEMKRLTLRADALEAMRKEIESLTSRLDSLNKTRNADRAEHARLTHLRTIAPQLRSLDVEREELVAFDDLPELSEQAVTRLREALEASEKSHLNRASATVALERSKAALDGITVDPAILAHQPSVQTLQTDIGKYQSAIRDRARVASEAEVKQGEINQMAARVGIAKDRLDSAQPTDAALAELEDLIAKWADLAHERATLEKSIADGKVKLKDLEGGQQASTLCDPATWRARFDAIGPGRTLLDRQRTLAHNSIATRRKLKERAARLTPPVLDLDHFASLSLPTLENLRGLGNRFAELENKRHLLEQEALTLDSAIEQVQRSLDAFQSGEPIASAERIAEARQEREESWHQLRSVVLGNDTSLPISSRPAVIELYEARIIEADRLADTATRDADRVAQYNTEHKTLKDKQQKRSKVQEQQAQTALDLQQASTEWLAIWMPVTASPATPSEMTSWIAAVKLLLDQRDPLVADEAELAALEPQIGELRTALDSLGRELALGITAELPTDSLLNLLDNHLKKLANAWNASAINQGLAADACKQVERFESKLAAHTAKETTWSGSWRIAVASLGFEAQASTAAVEAAVKVWRNLPARRVALESDRQRVRGMDRDIRDFEQEVTRLTGLIAPNLPPLPPVDQARRLGGILERQAGQQLLYNAAEVQVRTETRNLDEAERAYDRDTKLVFTRMSELALTGDPSLTLERLERAASIRSKIAAARTTLLAQSDGFSEDQLRTDLAEFDSQATLLTIQQLAQGFGAQDEEINQVFAAKSAAENALTKAELGSGAEVALQHMKGAEAEIDASAREYLVLKLSVTMLGRVIDEHRTAQSAPLMQSAGSLFQSLTIGAFTHIDQEFDPDDDDRPKLVGVRDTGKTVNIDGMSDGQRDQLYLALRLAYLDDYARKSDPVPFIGDDIFTTFDEPSTRAGLLALADIGAHLQPILFTHHRFVVDLALEALGDQVDVIDL